NEGNLCVRYYRRADGRIMTEECPVGLRRVQRPLKYLRAGVAIILTPLLSFAGIVYGYKLAGQPTDPAKGGDNAVAAVRTIQPFKAIAEWIDNPIFLPGDVVMGDVAAPAPALAPIPPAPQPPATAPNNQTPYHVTNDFGHDPAMLIGPATEPPRVQLITVERVVSAPSPPQSAPAPRVQLPVINEPLRVTGAVSPPPTTAPAVQAPQPRSYAVQTPSAEGTDPIPSPSPW
ncbi:MAG: hypothetical protein JOZ57_07245, partial [Abitibacteriaceae bacterium]|nr:hypothetical protein [Abditibacteriaceae bacterium]